MIRKLFIVSLLMMMIAVACAPAASEESTPVQTDGPVVTVYRAPT